MDQIGFGRVRPYYQTLQPLEGAARSFTFYLYNVTFLSLDFHGIRKSWRTIGAPEVMAKKDIEFDKDYASESVVRTWRGLRGDIPDHYRHVTYEPRVW
jgi:hypothetical protein